MFHLLWQFLSSISGDYHEGGPVYGFWSGFGGSWIIGYTGIALVYGWHMQCHVTHCYWPARRTTDAGDRACWRHHPHKKMTVETLHQRHFDAGNQNGA